jgi:hypothetical protein
MHPYFNQTWGFFAMPFAIVLAWWAVHHRSRGGLALLAAFLAIVGLSYPLALPIPLLSLAVFVVLDRRARGLSLRPRVGRVYRGPRSLLWMVPLGLVAYVPTIGVVEKMVTAARVILPGGDLTPWGGDLVGFYPTHQFFAAGSSAAFLLIAPIGAYAAYRALRAAPRDVRFGLGAVIAFGIAAGAYFTLRDTGWYFHFKVLAFTAPLAVACAVVGASRWRIVGPLLIIAFLFSARQGAVAELRETFDQLPRSILAVRDIDAALPPGASVRLDMNPEVQIWANYWLSGQPTCSQRPLTGTSYPHVPVSRAADYVLVDRGLRRPVDAAGAPVIRQEQFTLYRLRPGLPGGDRCSREMVQTVLSIE